MGAVVEGLVEWALILAAMTGLAAVLNRSLNSRYGGRVTGIIWTVLAVAWLLPIRPHLPLPSLPANGIPTLGEPVVVDMGGEASHSLTGPLAVALILWAAGTLIVGLRAITRRVRFASHLRRWEEEIGDTVLLRRVERECRAMGLSKVPRVVEMPGFTSPAVVGVWNPRLVVPGGELFASDLVLRHEIAHLVRRDPLWRLLLDCVLAIQWWNPFVHLAVRSAYASSEIASDQLAVDSSSGGERVKYAELLLACAVRSNRTLPLAVAFSPARKTLERRMASILDSTPKKRGWLLVGIILGTVLLAGMPIAIQTAPAVSEAAPVSVVTPKEDVVAESVPELGADSESISIVNNATELSGSSDLSPSSGNGEGLKLQHRHGQETGAHGESSSH